MASSNRHWPSMFRSKPVAACSAQPQGDMGNSSAATSVLSGSATGYSLKNPFSSGCEERSPEPKPRWNPKPEQIRILEAIFNSGMVNPPRDEIRRIRLQLQEYGQVGDANVFYWFQNRKSRSKNKQRAAGAPPGRTALSRACASPAAEPVTPPPQQPQIIAPVAPTSSSSSSSDRSSGSSKPVKLTTPTAPAAAHGTLSAAAMDLLSPLPAPAPTPALAPCQTYYHTQPPVPELAAPEPLLLQWAQGHYVSAAELAGIVSAHAPSPMLSPASPEVFLGMYSEVFGQSGCHRNYPKGLGQYWCSSTELSKSTVPREEEEEEQKGKLGLLQYGFGVTAATAAAAAALPLVPPVDAVVTVPNVTTAGVPSAAASSVATTTTSALNDHLQGLTEAGVVGGEAPMAAPVAVARGAVVCTSTAQYNVPAMHINVRLFGEAAVLFRHTGEPVLVDDSGVTVEPLQHGAIYYVLVD